MLGGLGGGLASTAQLAVNLSLKDGFTGPLKNAEHGLSNFDTKVGGVMGGVGKIGAGVGLAATRIAAFGVTAGVAIGGFAVAATKSAADFQSAMELIKTQAGGTQAEVDTMSKALLDLAPKVGTGPDQLAAGLYHIESAGLRGAQALSILQVAAEGAKVGQADLESVTNALIASVNSGIKGTTDMSQAMGVLNAVVGAGNMRMQDLADAFSTGILSTAKTFGISIQSIGAAIADMTNQGVPAIDAATRLRMSINLLGAPTAKAAKEFKSIGLGQLDLANAMRGPGGILSAIQMLAQHMQKAGLIDASGNVSAQGADLLSKAFGGGRSSSAIMTLIGSIQKFSDIQKQVNDNTNTFADSWAATQQEVDVMAGKVAASFDVLKIKLGAALLPAANNILTGLAGVLSDPAIQQGMTDFGTKLAAMFSPQNVQGAIQFAKDIIPPIESGLSVVFNLAKGAFDLFNSLPGPLKTVAIAALVGNKLTGGLVASGIGDIAKALLGGAGSKIPGVGGVLANLGGFGTPVRVTNWPANMGGGGGIPGGVGGAAGAAGGAEATIGGLSAFGFANAMAMAMAPLIMFDVIPYAFRQAQGTIITASRQIGGGTVTAGASTYQGFGNFGNVAAQAAALGVARLDLPTKIGESVYQGSERGISQLLPALNAQAAQTLSVVGTHAAQEVMPITQALNISKTVLAAKLDGVNAKLQRMANVRQTINVKLQAVPLTIRIGAGSAGGTINRSVQLYAGKPVPI